MLLALGEIQRGNAGFIPYATIEPRLKDLLVDFGPPRKTIYSTFPFIRLANDGLWQFNKPELLNTKQDYTSKYLLSNDVQGKFPDEIVQHLKKNPSLLSSVAELILEQNFPETIHQDILDAVGLQITFNPSVSRPVRRRDPLFRENVLKAYEYQCAVCGFSVRLKNKILALEAAHIKWHQAGGPDEEVNGLALCATHHKLFDLGAFTLNYELQMLVSDEVNGQGANEWLIQHHGKYIKPPQKKAFYPSPNFTAWHVNEVFKGGYREC
nr:HNH endonuclease [Adhaeribacter arboris]